MEFIIYVLISISMSSVGALNYYNPAVYSTELECEEIRMKMAEFIKSDSIIGSTSVCIKVEIVPKEEEEEKEV